MAKVAVSLKVPEGGLSLDGPDLYEVWLPGFHCGHVGAHGTKWRQYSAAHGPDDRRVLRHPGSACEGAGVPLGR